MQEAVGLVGYSPVLLNRTGSFGVIAFTLSVQQRQVHRLHEVGEAIASRKLFARCTPRVRLRKCTHYCVKCVIGFPRIRSIPSFKRRSKMRQLREAI